MKTCSLPECTTEFVPERGKIYCSSEHRDLTRSRKRAKAKKSGSSITINCRECDATLVTSDKRQKYCSRRCAALSGNRLRSDAKVKRYCDRCPNRLNWTQKRFCSRTCAFSFRREETVRKWLLGQDSGSQENGLLKKVCRSYLMEKAKDRCQSPTCAVPGGWSVPNPVTGKVILTVDHIDGNWKNNSFDNLIVLCYSCHTLTPTFGSLNTKSAGIRGSGPRANQKYTEKRRKEENNGRLA